MPPSLQGASYRHPQSLFSHTGGVTGPIFACCQCLRHAGYTLSLKQWQNRNACTVLAIQTCTSHHQHILLFQLCPCYNCNQGPVWPWGCCQCVGDAVQLEWQQGHQRRRHLCAAGRFHEPVQCLHHGRASASAPAYLPIIILYSLYPKLPKRQLLYPCAHSHATQGTAAHTLVQFMHPTKCS